MRGGLTHVAAIGQARQQAVRGAHDEAGLSGELRDTEIAGLPEGLEQVEGPVYRLDAVTTWIGHGTMVDYSEVVFHIVDTAPIGRGLTE